ncbi:hypothetical protein R3W88_011600 [Solanum pinnatisectum]|uniref:Retrotransposon Copia-like N-terminal domain-containing protein n=1 Tax=Solanum pinnatisectum TaxID=50273 RepID=A0AAV9L7Z7_9SOLN|nr:hypothetical protein R3W88_011600 [Solanum pinnatisectum]
MADISQEIHNESNITDFSSGGNLGNNNPTQATSMSQGMDYNHPPFLSPADISGVNLISFQLVGIENYVVWSRSIRLALLGRNKIGFRVNVVVLSWLLNFVSKSLLGGLAFATTAQSSVFVYFTKLKNLWDEFEALVPSPGCNCERSRGFIYHVNRGINSINSLGLNESYRQARSQILLINIVLGVSQAYVMLVSDECQ